MPYELFRPDVAGTDMIMAILKLMNKIKKNHNVSLIVLNFVILQVFKITGEAKITYVNIGVAKIKFK